MGKTCRPQSLDGACYGVCCELGHGMELLFLEEVALIFMSIWSFRAN